MFLIIAEILPTSFAQILFHLKLLYSPRTRSSRRCSGILVLASGVVYGGIVAATPWAGTQLIKMVLCARVALVLPALFTHEAQQVDSESVGDLEGYLSSGQTMLLVAGYAGPDLMNPSGALTALNANPAVSAIGYDFLISCVAWIAWHYQRHSLPHPPQTILQNIKTG